MGLFDFFKKSASPYKDAATNLIYELLFCDDISLYKNNNQQPDSYPWNILFSGTANAPDLLKIIADNDIESRVKILACNKMIANSQKINKKELLGVIVEVGLDNGLDVLASFSDGTARYINQMGGIIIWEAVDDTSNSLTKKLFNNSLNVVMQIGPWNEPRRPHPPKGTVRITFLVSDGLYFGEGTMKVLFSDPLAGPALSSAMELMKYMMEKSNAKK
ncbi:MAG TPA: hypothetical protein VNX40_12590 [Mucilaginibacter sp.]|nr:hypothetical protein [Mucilaginibacter sp.]